MRLRCAPRLCRGQLWIAGACQLEGVHQVGGAGGAGEGQRDGEGGRAKREGHGVSLCDAGAVRQSAKRATGAAPRR